MPIQYYWCLSHQRVEQGAQCRALDRLGPYGSEEEARHWRDRHEQRTERWEEEDERWDAWKDGDQRPDADPPT
jgi:hypothetical protein